MVATSKRAVSATRYLFIDALRGIAALMVVLFHAQAGRHIDGFVPHLPAPARWLFDHGHTGVFVFFVISGFVIANTLVPQTVTAKSAAIFMARRAVRLDPPYWVSMALVIALAAISARFVGGDFHFPSARTLLLHVLYLPDLFDERLLTDVYWTLCIEVQFYLTFALLMLLVAALTPRLGKERALDVVIWPCTLFANLWAVESAPFVVPGLFLDYWYMFLAGVLVWRAVQREPRSNALPLTVALLDLGVLGYAAFHFQSVTLSVGTLSGALVLAGGLLGKLRTWLSARPFQFLGAISYSLYLVHNPLTGAGFHVGYMLTGRNSPWHEALWLVLVVSGCIVGAWLFYWAIEAPSIALSRRVGNRLSATTLDSAAASAGEARESVA